VKKIAILHRLALLLSIETNWGAVMNVRLIFILFVFFIFNSPVFASGSVSSQIKVNAQFNSKRVEALDFIDSFRKILLSEEARAELYFQSDPDPWINTRYELENLTEQPLFFSLDIRMLTQPTSGPTVKDAFMNIELFDINNDANASVSDAISSFTVIDDDGGDFITAQDTLAQSSSFQFITGEGSHSIFDVAGTGPNSGLFEDSDGFNYIRFLTNGYISAGDKLIITAMGCYANNSIDCPERFIIPPKVVPIPSAIWLYSIGLLGLMRISRRKTTV